MCHRHPWDEGDGGLTSSLEIHWLFLFSASSVLCPSDPHLVSQWAVLMVLAFSFDPRVSYRSVAKQLVWPKQLWHRVAFWKVLLLPGCVFAEAEDCRVSLQQGCWSAHVMEFSTFGFPFRESQ